MNLRSEAVPGLPHPSLRSYVKRYTGFVEHADGPVRRREMPFGGVAVILALEDSWRLALHEDAPLLRHRSFAGGIIDRPAVSEHAGYAHALQFDLTPLGALALLGVPGSEIAGQIVPLDALLGYDAERLVDELVHTPQWPQRFATLDAWLLGRLSRERISPDVAWAWRRLVETGGALPIGALTDEIGCSGRHLASRFRHDVGATPKAFARLVRFEVVTERLRHSDDELGVIALDAGYYDQAHFNRDVKHFAGVAPGALMRERRAGGFVL